MGTVWGEVVEFGRLDKKLENSKKISKLKILDVGFELRAADYLKFCSIHGDKL